MGVAIAEAALDRGARVSLIAGSVEVALPAEAEVSRVESTAELGVALAAMLQAGPAGRAGFDALIMAAAVADFRPRRPARAKLRRGSTPDPRSRAHARPVGRGRRGCPPPLADPGPGRLRGRDRLARAGSRQAPPQGRRPARGQRRGRTGLRLRDRTQSIGSPCSPRTCSGQECWPLLTKTRGRGSAPRSHCAARLDARDSAAGALDEATSRRSLRS